MCFVHVHGTTDRTPASFQTIAVFFAHRAGIAFDPSNQYKIEHKINHIAIVAEKCCCAVRATNKWLIIRWLERVR